LILRNRTADAVAAAVNILVTPRPNDSKDEAGRAARFHDAARFAAAV
jgi:hypothetical protein